MFSQRLPSSVYAGYGPWKFNEGWVSKHGNQTIRKPTGIGKCGFHLSTEEESLSLKYFDRVVLKSHTYITYHMYTSGFSSLRIFLFFEFLLHVGPSRNPQLPRGGSVLGGGEQWHGGGGAGGGPRNANLFQDSTPGTDWVMASKGQRNPMESPTAWLSIGYWNHTAALTMNGSFQWFQHVPNFQVMIATKRPWVARRFLFTYGYLPSVQGESDAIEGDACVFYDPNLGVWSSASWCRIGSSKAANAKDCKLFRMSSGRLFNSILRMSPNTYPNYPRIAPMADRADDRSHSHSNRCPKEGISLAQSVPGQNATGTWCQTRHLSLFAVPGQI